MLLRRAAKTMVLVALGLGLAAFGRCGNAEPNWKLTWSDEFEGPALQSPDPAKWAFDVGTGAGGWGNQQWEYDTDRPENASLDGNGNLAIRAIHEPYRGMQFTSARLLTRGLFEQRYGRFEARIKLPHGQGIWPAFWLLGSDFATGGWPACGEIDIMEYRGQEPRVVTGSVHGPGYSGSMAITGSKRLASGAGFDEDFHVFAVEWTPDWIIWEVDGAAWQVVDPTALPAKSPWAFDHPFYAILNMAVGGLYVGDPDPAVFPQTMLVDYVRVYERVP
jgi:beta-glucanase (GH16 family)